MEMSGDVDLYLNARTKFTRLDPSARSDVKWCSMSDLTPKERRRIYEEEKARNQCMTKVTVFVSLLFCLCWAGCSRADHPDASLRDVYRSARSIQAALEVGTSYPEFSSLVIGFSRELKFLDDKVALEPSVLPPEAPVVAKRYRELLEIYHDAAVVWSMEIRDQKQSQELQGLAKKYAVPEAIRMYPQLSSVVENVNYDAIRQSAWRKADQIQAQITPILFGRPSGSK
jgi:hypothetical protein